jgi:hypothetical protein
MNFIKAILHSKDADRTVSVQADKQIPEGDPRMQNFVHIIRWQGRIILVFLAIVTLMVIWQARGLPFPWPKHEIQTVAYSPPVDPKAIIYNMFAYADSKVVQDNATIQTRDISILGQIYDFDTVKEKWPDVTMLINGASVPLSKAGNCLAQYQLKPGENIFYTSVVIDGTELGKKQMRINYQPKASNP